MGLGGLALLAIFAIVRPIMRYWLYRQPHTRPPIFRHSEHARLIDFLLWIMLIGGTFLMINWKPKLGIAIAILTVCFDFLMKLLLLNLEVRRLRREDHHVSPRSARRHIQERARQMLSP
jgi:hypothetical protein